MIEMIIMLTLCGQPFGTIAQLPEGNWGLTNASTEALTYLKQNAGPETGFVKIDLAPLVGVKCTTA